MTIFRIICIVVCPSPPYIYGIYDEGTVDILKLYDNSYSSLKLIAIRLVFFFIVKNRVLPALHRFNRLMI